jgi:hypothetical protein
MAIIASEMDGVMNPPEKRAFLSALASHQWPPPPSTEKG